ncbi:hypothetical protein ABTE34_20185, partial [Acinetobacter baumannii]
WPQQVLDVDGELPAADAGLLFDRQRGVSALAHGLGVVNAPVREYSFEDEAAADEYQDWVLADLNSRLTPGDRPIERITLYPSQGHSAGPF